jgi:hypothetical protein
MAAVHDAETALSQQAIPWFARYSTPEIALQTLISGDEDRSMVWGIGSSSSPVRHYMTGYMALALGNRELAATHLKAALDTGVFVANRTRLQQDLVLAASGRGMLQ